MKLVALDSHTLNFDLLDWSALNSLAEVFLYPRTTAEQALQRAQACDGLILNKFVLTRDLIAELKSLRYVGISATGTNNVDLLACQESGIAVTNVAGYSTLSVAQYVIGCILQHYTRLIPYSQSVADFSWCQAQDFCMPRADQREVSGLSLGIFGKGAIGEQVALLAKSLGMRVQFAALPGRPSRADRVSIKGLVSGSDIISLHCPLNSMTSIIINSEILSYMKPNSILINTARGDLIDEHALAQALGQGRVAHAYLDVLSSEPPSSTNPLLRAKNVTITPHIAWASRETRQRLLNEVTENVRAFIAGQRRNRVV